MAETQTKKRRSSWEVCADAVAEMRAIVDDLEGYSGVYEETRALRKQIARVERACGRVWEVPERTGEDISADTDDPRDAAQVLVSQLPLETIFQDQALANAFLAELMLAIARESSSRSRRERQKKGIQKAKAQGVRFGAPARPLPDNFEDARLAWRSGQITLKEAAQRCDMPRTTFYSAVQRVEQNMDQSVSRPKTGRPRAQA